MKFSIDLNELQYVLKCLRVSIRATSTEAEGRIFITASEENSATFSTTNGSISTSIKTSLLKLDSPGLVSVIYSELQGFVNAFKPWEEGRGGVKEVTFKLNDKTLSIIVENNCGGSSVSKSSIKLKIYEVLAEGALTFGPVSFVLNSSMLKASLDKIMWAIDPLNHNVYLRGLNINFTKEFVYFAGTNGIIVSEYAIKNTSTISDKSYLLTYDFAKGMRGLLANIPKEEVQVEFSTTDKHIKLRVNDILFTGQLVVGHTYPDYRAVFTKPYKNKVILDRALLLDNLTPIVGTLVTDDNNRMSILIEGQTIKLFNDFSESIFNLETPFDGSFVVDINGKLCKDIVSTIRDDKLFLYFNNEKDNIVFDSEMFEDQKTLLTFIRRRHV